ncbi:MAG: helix-hairpin-helix domain-containing protein, partial [Dehalococcoidia bacterium]|nr:helix-hairpin-helix domain-containing protein [Dehalococcoidia bacterium]
VGKVEQAIKNADTDFFTTVPRLGRKNAQKIIIELKNKLGGLKELDLTEESEENTQAIEALRNLGYTRQEALQAIAAVPSSEKTPEQKISYALRQLGKKL